MVYDSTAPLRPCEFRRTGYTLDHWESPGGKFSDRDNVRSITVADSITLTAVWRANTYTVAFDPGDGEGSMGPEVFTYDTGRKLPACSFSMTGHHFAGWSSDSGSYTDESIIRNIATSGKVTFTATWKPNTYTVVFDPGSGTGTAVVRTLTYDVPYELEPCGFSMTGYSFSGWSTPSGPIPAAGTLLNVLESGSTTYTAIWEPNTYTVVFDPGDAPGLPVRETFVYDRSYDAGDRGFTRPGYTFVSWRSEVSRFSGTEGLMNLAESGEVGLTACWSPNGYDVVFRSDGIAAEGCVQHLVYDTESRLDACTYVKPGYRFVGWTSEGGPYGDGDAVRNLAESGSVFMDAVWEPNVYDVVFMPCGGIGTMDVQRFTYDESQTLTSCGFSRTGHTFAGWSDVPDGEPVYGQCQKVSNLAEGGEKKLYASWSLNSHTVSFDTLVHGTVADISVCYGEEIVPPDPPAWKGHTFAGWGPSYDAMPNEDVVLTASWTVNTYSVRYIGPSGPIAVQDADYDEELSIRGCSEKMEGHTFAGWNTDEDGGGTAYAPGSAASGLAESGTVDLYAQWSVDVHSLRFHFGNGETAVVTGGYGSGVEPPSVPERTGFVFRGWDPMVPVTVPARDMDLNAQWDPVRYRVAVHAMTGPSLSDLLPAEFGEELVLPDPGAVPEGKRFLGWSLTEDGEPELQPGDAVSDLCLSDGDTVQLYPVTEDVVYHLMFVGADGGLLGSFEGTYLMPVDPACVPSDPVEGAYVWDGAVPDLMPSNDVLLRVVEPSGPEDGGGFEFPFAAAVMAGFALAIGVLCAAILRRKM